MKIKHEIVSAFSDSDGVVRGFMDATDFIYELGAAAGGNSVYSSVEEVKRHRRCWQQCGIVEVEVRAVRAVVSGDEPGSPKVKP